MSTEFDAEDWRSELEAHREEKDEFFRTHRQSPVPAAARDEFGAVPYFEPDSAYRVEATVEPADGDDTTTMETTADTEQEYVRVAELAFEIEGEEHSLVAYESVDGQGDELFVPFRDTTTGQATYGGGRYMEFEVDSEASASDASDGRREAPPDERTASDASREQASREQASHEQASREPSDSRAGDIREADTVTLDFNLAYHPFCVYNDAFVCPLPPEENWLETEIRAGERLPPEGEYEFARGNRGQGHPH